MTGLGSALVASLGPGSMPILAYAIALGALMLPPLWAIGTCGSVVAAFAVVTALDDDKPWGAWAALLSITIALVLMGMLVRSNQELVHARHELAALAVAQERARVARDLHDVLGHSLTSLAVKASLARRLLDKGLVRQAVSEVADIERQARKALVDVRATVSGYREASLAAEVAGARVALEAGEIEATVSGDLDAVPPHLREPFAYVVREAVTNVIRHSASKSCVIQIGQSYVEIVDEGGPVVASAADGNGLTGLRQRLEAVGGRLLAGPAPGGGFRLRAEVSPS
jgi:two-component system sensor histidine kinase DesK